MTDNHKEREAFEDHTRIEAEKLGQDANELLRRKPDGERYFDKIVAAAWLGWLARASRPTQPQGDVVSEISCAECGTVFTVGPKDILCKDCVKPPSINLQKVGFTCERTQERHTFEGMHDFVMAFLTVKRERDEAKAVLSAMPQMPGDEIHKIANEVRTALDRKSCPDAYMRIAYEAVETALLKHMRGSDDN